MFNPSKIILSGDGVKAGDLMFEHMQKTIRNYSNEEILKSTEFVIQEWQDTDWARGAASLVLQELYKSPFNSVKPII